ncbi:MAG: carbohydrate kinase family protein [Anaerolineae bacterium]|nr:carbohydrate kinase family protein [Anaerolineae bacterium]
MTHQSSSDISPPTIACLGFINPGLALSVDHYPLANGGTFVQAKKFYLGSDAVIVANALSKWGMKAHLITNALGDDTMGRNAKRQLQAAGVLGELILQPNVATPVEIDVCDQQGKRTWFVEQAWSLFGTIAAADLTPIQHANMLYIDWYAGEDVVDRALQTAQTQGVPVYLNVECTAAEPERYAEWIKRADLVQTWINDDDVSRNDATVAWELAERLCKLGAKVAVVTRGKDGCVARSATESVSLQAPKVAIVGTLGAGAIFSAGMMYGHHRGWSLLDTARFAMYAASLKCRNLIPEAPNANEILGAIWQS